MKIAIGSDKSGFSAKEAIKAWLMEAGIEFDDLGTTDLEQVHPYYQVASEVAPLVQNGTYERAVLICGTGAGMCVVSNKFFVCTDVDCVLEKNALYRMIWPTMASTRRVIAVSATMRMSEMVKTFLNTAWCQDLEDWRAVNMHKFAAKVDEIEANIYGA